MHLFTAIIWITAGVFLYLQANLFSALFYALITLYAAVVIYYLRQLKYKPAGETKSQPGITDNSKNECIDHEVDDFAGKLSGILQNMENGFISLNQCFEIDYVNIRAEYLLQLPPSSIGKNLFSINSLFAETKFKQLLENSMKHWEVADHVCEHLDSSLHIRINPTNTGLSLYVKDITSELADKSELNLLRTAIDKANDVVLITTAQINSPGPQVVYVNDAFERVTGYKKSDILGRCPRMLQGKETEPHKRAEIKEALLASQPIRTLMKNYKKDGTLYYNEIDISPIQDSNNKITHFVSIQRDISKQKQQEDLAFRAHKMDSIGLVTGGVAHDFNNLLTIIIGNCEIIEDISEQDQKDFSSQLEKLAEIAGAAKQGVALTRSLLAFSKRQPVNKNNVDLTKLITSVKPLIASALGAQISFSLLNKSNTNAIAGDRSQLESMFLNMAINARDAMQGKGNFTITIDNDVVAKDSELNNALKVGQYIVVTFTDNGSGIDEKTIEKIFDPFFSTKSLNKGTGLGLSMIYTYVKRSGGHIFVDSNVGAGTCFSVYLPLDSADIHKAEKTKTKPTPVKDSHKDTKARYLGKKVLIVEDTIMVAKVAKYIFTSLGFEVNHVSDGIQAVKAFKEDKDYDLLFTDVILPGELNGKSVADQLRDELPSLPVIFTSGFTDGQLQEQDYNQLNTEFLQKPYTQKTLIETLGKIVLD